MRLEANHKHSKTWEITNTLNKIYIIESNYKKFQGSTKRLMTISTSHPKIWQFAALSLALEVHYIKLITNTTTFKYIDVDYIYCHMLCILHVIL